MDGTLKDVCFPSGYMAQRTIVIGISGAKGAGKSTLQRMVKDRIIAVAGGQCSIHEFGLANRMKSDVAELFGHDCSRELTGESRHRESDLPVGMAGLDKQTYRRLLQTIGQKMREIDPYWWIRYVHNAIMGLSYSVHKHVVIIPDVRFANETEYVQRWPHHICAWVGFRPARNTDTDISERFSDMDQWASTVADCTWSWVREDGPDSLVNMQRFAAEMVDAIVECL